MSFAEFIHMGGYAFYVWTSYAIVLVVLTANIFLPLKHKRDILRKIARQQRQSGENR